MRERGSTAPEQQSSPSHKQLDIYLRLVGQEGDVDLRQSLDGFGSATLRQLVEERIRAGCQGEID